MLKNDYTERIKKYLADIEYTRGKDNKLKITIQLLNFIGENEGLLHPWTFKMNVFSINAKT
jgi:hypothetical protein